MRLTLFYLSLVSAIIFVSCSSQTVESQKMDAPQNQNINDSNKKSPVLVELFTSEGCSSCPPADTALAFLEKEQPFMQAEIITLALHVDYWNNLGWRDEYSSPLYSQRQTVYVQKLKLDSTYTPQMIVDGRLQFVGSNLGEASKAILEAAKSPKANIEIEYGSAEMKIKIFDVPEHEETSVFLAVAEDNLVSNIKRGENAGKNLTHTSVARELRPVGRIEARSYSFEKSIAPPQDARWKSENLSYVVFIQENNSRKILGAAQFRLNEK